MTSASPGVSPLQARRLWQTARVGITPQQFERMQSRLRTVDALGRFGGEEFMVLMPGTHITGAREAANRMRMALEETPLQIHDASITLTASFGAAVLGSKENQVRKVLRPS